MLQNIPNLNRSLTELLARFPFPIWHCRPDGSRDFFNDEWLKFTGRTLEEELQMGWLKSIHKDDADNYLKRYKEGIALSKPFDAEFRIRHADGGFRYVYENIIPLSGKEDPSAGFIGVLTDITRIKRYQAEISSYAAREKFLKDSLPDAFIILDYSGNILSWNKAAEKLFGYEQSEILGRSFKYLIPERHHEIFLQRMNELLRSIKEKNHVAGTIEGKALRRDGSEAYILISYMAAANDQNEQIMLLIKDVTDQRIRVKRLLKEQERLRSIIESSSVGVALLTYDGMIIYANKALALLLDTMHEKLVGMTLLDLVHPEDKNHMLQDLNNIIAGKSDYAKTEARFRRADNQFIWAAISIDRYQPYQDGVSYLMLEVVDITDIKRIEEQLSEEIRELRAEIEKKTGELESARHLAAEDEKLINLGMSLAQITHDIRNPLTAIDLGLYALENSMNEKNENTEKIIATMRSALKQANDIITELTQFVKPTPPKRVKVMLKDIVDDALSTLTLPAGISKQVDVKDDDAVYGDDVQISRILQNLVKNAVEAMPQGGILKIWTERDSDFLTLSVSDTGKGMSKEVKEKLFSPFFTTKEKGLGLGLAIVKKFVTDLGGQIEVDTEEGKGTTFRVKLPIFK